MMRMLAGLFLATLATAGGAQEGSRQACAAIDADLPKELAAWKEGANPAGRRLFVGRAETVTLRPVPEVRYAAAPQRPAPAGTFGTALTINVARAGTYRVALSEAAWIDVVAAGKTISSTAHGHGPTCSSIRKIVDFPLSPGRHVLQLGGSNKDRVAVLVIPAR